MRSSSVVFVEQLSALPILPNALLANPYRAGIEEKAFIQTAFAVQPKFAPGRALFPAGPNFFQQRQSRP
jgi:hypothetical protein